MSKTQKSNSSKFGGEFQEVGHCGGQFIVNVRTSEDERRSFNVEISHSRPVPASWFGIYADMQGNPVGMMNLGGISANQSSSDFQGYFPLMIGSDSHSMFGHQCQRCKGYWRSKSAPNRWNITCPYCGLNYSGFVFLTCGQTNYVKACCNLILEAMENTEDGQSKIDLDKIADDMSKGSPKPKFYHVEQSQQNLYICSACGDVNDILGRFGFCSCCGTYNGMQEIKKDLKNISERINSAGTSDEFVSCVKDVTSLFDSLGRKFIKQFLNRIPMTKRRRQNWEKRKFHNLNLAASSLKTDFDIDVFKNFNEEDKKFSILMFHRRHVYEHNGGEADEKYIKDSGDVSVKPKQMIRESKESATRFVELVRRLGENFHEGFHDIFPPEEKPVSMHKERLDRLQSRRATA